MAGVSGGLNPSFAQQPGRTLPLNLGYVLLSGDQLLFTTKFTTTGQGDNYVLVILGEGEMDSKYIPLMYMPPIVPTGDGLGTGSGTTALCAGLSTTLDLFSTLTSGSRFHNGRWGVKGSNGFFCSVGGDQFSDVWASCFPNVTPPQQFSGVAYELTLGPGPFTMESGSGDDSITFDPSPAPVGVYRGLRCRLYNDEGIVTAYGFTTNPAWHLVEVLMRYKYKTQQVPLAGLTDAEKQWTFNWPSVVAYAARCAYILTNGAPRFASNFCFAADQTLTDIIESLLRVSRGYLVRLGGQIYLMGDDERDSTFCFDASDEIPGTFTMDKKNIAKAGNVFIPKYRDLNIPAVSGCVSIENYEDMGLDYSSPLIPRGQSTVLIRTDGINPFTVSNVVTLGGSIDDDGGSSWDGDYVVGFPFGDTTVNDGNTDIGIGTDGVSILAPGPGWGVGSSASGGYLGVQNARFAQRAPTNVRHRAHQLYTGGPDAPGLATRLNVVPVNYDMGNMTFDQAIRLMTFEMIRDLGLDVSPYIAPFSGKISGFIDSVDKNGNALIDQAPGQIITLDEWVSPEFAGDYEVQERIIHAPSLKKQGTIDLVIQSKTDSSAYTDVVVTPDATQFTVPNAGLPMGDFIPVARPYYVLQGTPYSDGSGTVTIDDLSIWWAGATAPTAYSFSVSGLAGYSTYALYMQDTDGEGIDIVFGAVEGEDFSAVPTGYIPVGMISTGYMSGAVLGYSYSYDGTMYFKTTKHYYDGKWFSTSGYSVDGEWYPETVE